MRKLLRSLSSVYLVNVVNGVLGVVFVPVALRRLGPAGYGLYGVYAVLAGYVALVELGLGKNLLRILAGRTDPDARRDELQVAFGAYLGISAALLVALPALAYLVPRVVFPVPPDLRGAVAWITACAVAEYVVGIPASMMQTRCVADEDFRRYSRFALASGLVRYGFSFAGVLLFRRPEQVVAVIVARRVVDVALARRLLGPLPAGAWRPRFAPRAVARMLGNSSLLSVAQVLQLTVVSLGAVLVNWSFGVRGLGVYRAVFDLASKVWFFSNAIGLVIFPRFVRLLAAPEQRGRLRAALPRLLEASWLGYAVLAVLGALVGPAVLGRVGMGGAEYTSLFVLVAAGICFNAHSNLAYEFLQAAGSYARVVGLAAVSLALMAAIFALTRGPAAGLAIGWAWLGSQMAYSLASDLIVERTLEVASGDMRRGLGSRAAAAVAVAGAAAVGGTGWAVGAPGVALVLAAAVMVAAAVRCGRAVPAALAAA